MAAMKVAQEASVEAMAAMTIKEEVGKEDEEEKEKKAEANKLPQIPLTGSDTRKKSIFDVLEQSQLEQLPTPQPEKMQRRQSAALLLLQKHSKNFAELAQAAAGTDNKLKDIQAQLDRNRRDSHT